MLEFEDVTLRNFMSWGDYDTTVKLSDMQQCLIVGELEVLDIEEEDEDQAIYSNGAGKSSLFQSIIWCLFGKTVYNKNPGDRILNWFTGGDCHVRVRFKNGDQVIRIRTRSGDTHLIYHRQDKEIINCALSTTTNQQTRLERELGIDYDIFCGSSFLHDRPWMKMSDQKRKEVLERVMGLDRIAAYAQAAKQRREAVERFQQRTKIESDALHSATTSLEQQLTLAQQASEKFNNSKQQRYDTKIAEAHQIEQAAAEVSQIDLQKLANKWALVQKIRDKIDEIRKSVISAEAAMLNSDNERLAELLEIDRTANNTNQEIATRRIATTTKYNSDKAALDNKKSSDLSKCQSTKYTLESQSETLKAKIDQVAAFIAAWRSKSGKICDKCEQPIGDQHVCSKIEPYQEQLEKYQKELAGVQYKLTLITTAIDDIKSKHSTALGELTRSHETEMSKLDNEEIGADIATGLAKKRVEDLYAEQLAQLQQKKLSLTQSLSTVQEKLDGNTPQYTVDEARRLNYRRQELLDLALRAKAEADTILAEQDPNSEVSATLQKAIDANKTKLALFTRQLGDSDIIYAHVNYIYRAYNDRRKIKTYWAAKRCPKFNERLLYYLDLFHCDVKLSLTDSLALDSNLWGYDMESTGEKSRTDLSFVLAAFDLHESIYESQSNILVLDEPEKGLDAAGRRALAEIINDELASRFESIFIISHDERLHNQFPRRITIARSADRLSRLAEMR